ncbi:MAG: hypothetical protein KBD01_00460 [Acidobacteria bacterium]|nr:hypothetical protein [Acidobacteriota bacterium]
MRFASRIFALAGLLAFPPTWAGDDERLNYAFASQLGSGIYNVSGRTVQVYRIPFTLPARKAEGTVPGFRVNLPLCFGFFDFDDTEADQAGADEHVGTASVVPGIAVEIGVLRNWSLQPFVDLGIARELGGSGDAYVYAAGVKSVATFRAGPHELLLGNRIVYVGEHTPGTKIDEDYATLETAFEVRRPLGWAVKSHGLDWSVYVISYLYLEPTEVWIKEEPLDVGAQYEVGLTVGTQVPAGLWLFEVPRIGLGYRFGDGVSAVRVLVGGAF